MKSGLISDVILPISLAIIMLGMGLSLVVGDFKRILKYPKAVFLGLFSQLILLPILGFGIAKVFNLEPVFAVGLVILAACPGGVTSNLISHLAKGNTALSVTLTAFSSLITFFSIPFLVNLGIQFFYKSEGAEIQLPIVKTMGAVFLITILPVLLGMLIRRYAETFALKMERPVKIISAVILAVIVAGAILKNKEVFTRDYIFLIIGACLALNVSSMGVGFLIAFLGKLGLREKATLSIETGIQNGTTAIFIATTLLKNEVMSITPGIYSLLMFVTGGLAIGFFASKIKSDTKSSSSKVQQSEVLDENIV